MPIYDDDHLTTSFNTSELEKDTSVMNDLKTYQTFAGTKITNDFNLSYTYGVGTMHTYEEYFILI